MYTNTDDLLAKKFPHLPKSWLEEVNRELGTCNGNAKVTAQFSGFEVRWTDWTKRILGKLRPGRINKDI